MIRLKTMNATLGFSSLLFGVLVQTAPLCAQETAPTEPAVTLSGVLARLERQEAELASQRETIARQQEAIAIQTDAIQSLQTRVDQLGAGTRPALTADQPTLTAEENTIRARLESLEATVEQADASPQQQETTTTYDESEFPGAVPVPGTRAALRYRRQGFLPPLTSILRQRGLLSTRYLSSSSQSSWQVAGFNDTTPHNAH